MPAPTAEHARLDETRRGVANWKLWGPYVAERAWGTVREDYSADGNAWDYFPHDHARSKAYRWGEDGLAAVCDRYQLLVFALALWNGRDPILKERLFGLVPGQANHGEDVKEYYFYLDATPTYSYAKFLYKYPQVEFPYERLTRAGRLATPADPEFELLETGAFDGDRYFDVFVEYAKAGPDDLCVRVEVVNRGPEPAVIHLLPHLWFRNRWSWGPEPLPKPVIRRGAEGELIADDTSGVPLGGLLTDYRLGPRYLYAEPGGLPLFTDNETHAERVHGPGAVSASAYTKDAFHRRIIQGEPCTNPAETGTKACIHYEGLTLPPGGSRVIRLRLTDHPRPQPLADVDAVVADRRREADAFFAHVHPVTATADERLVQRQALAGLLWTKQVYLFDVRRWLEGDNSNWPPPPHRGRIRNEHWKHLNSHRILSVPDKWEYPWFAAWDLAFHCVPLTIVDPDFAKEQLWLLLFEQFQHPNGQIPAYEWEFSDLNPPVHAWAVWRVFRQDRRMSGRGDRDFLERCFHKLLLNFTWWVNRVDADGNNVFEGGFLGLDNITVYDRSQKLPGGATLKQSDATGWMGMYCLTMMRMALELAEDNPSYTALATKFLEHYVVIGAAMKQMGGGDYELWSETDGFFYDVLVWPDGRCDRLRVRSLVGLIPLFALDYLDEAVIAKFPGFKANLEWYLRNRPETSRRCITVLDRPEGRRYILSLLDPAQLRRVLKRVWDPDEFRAPFGLRSLSKVHRDRPFVYGDKAVGYEPAEAITALKGGNSNWRGPVWFPTTFLLIEALRRYAAAYGESTAVDGPGSPGFAEMARWFANRQISLFTRDEAGRRPAHGKTTHFQDDPYWRDLILFYEYFHGDTGAGLGASHQTGWTALVATLLDEWREGGGGGGFVGRTRTSRPSQQPV